MLPSSGLFSWQKVLIASLVSTFASPSAQVFWVFACRPFFVHGTMAYEVGGPLYGGSSAASACCGVGRE